MFYYFLGAKHPAFSAIAFPAFRYNLLWRKKSPQKDFPFNRGYLRKCVAFLETPVPIAVDKRESPQLEIPKRFSSRCNNNLKKSAPIRVIRKNPRLKIFQLITVFQPQQNRIEQEILENPHPK